MNPNFPLYIVSKGRADSRYTARFLEAMGVPYFIVVEEQEWPAYTAVIDPAKVIVLDKAYQRDYDTFDELGDTKSKGPGPARNFAWDHSIRNGHEWHWVMDDNIRGFYYSNNNLQFRLADGTGFRCMEDFVLRYTNVAMAGPNYYMFVPRKQKRKPFFTNTRIYSCNLIRNDLHFRWRGRYNEDTDLSLRMLKEGWCTIQFNIFLQNKMNTQTVPGGNTEEFYRHEGTMAKSQMQYAMHPDVSKVLIKYGRWHHEVDYSGFQKTKLQRKPNLPPAIDYGFAVRAADSVQLDRMSRLLD